MDKQAKIEQRMSLMLGWRTDITIDVLFSLVVLARYFYSRFVIHLSKCAIADGKIRFEQKHENLGLLIPYLAWRGVYLVSWQGYIDFDRALNEYYK